MSEGHFDWIGDRTNRLGFERVGATVPELFFAEDAVVGDGRVAIAGLPADTDTELRILGITEAWVMAVGAAYFGILGESLVEEQLAAKFNFGAG